MLLPQRQGGRRAPLRRVIEKALAPVGRIRSIVVDAVLAVDFLVSSTQAAQHVAAAKHRLRTDRPPTTSFGFCGGFCALMDDKPSCAADKQVGQRASQGDAGGQDEHALAAGTLATLHRALDAVHGGKTNGHGGYTRTTTTGLYTSACCMLAPPRPHSTTIMRLAAPRDPFPALRHYSTLYTHDVGHCRLEPPTHPHTTPTSS